VFIVELVRVDGGRKYVAEIRETCYFRAVVIEIMAVAG
jgi:hypothetical protein